MHDELIDGSEDAGFKFFAYSATTSSRPSCEEMGRRALLGSAAG